jgi:hypothetical protein
MGAGKTDSSRYAFSEHQRKQETVVGVDGNIAFENAIKHPLQPANKAAKKTMADVF